MAVWSHSIGLLPTLSFLTLMTSPPVGVSHSVPGGSMGAEHFGVTFPLWTLSLSPELYRRLYHKSGFSPATTAIFNLSAFQSFKSAYYLVIVTVSHPSKIKVNRNLHYAL